MKLLKAGRLTTVCVTGMAAVLVALVTACGDSEESAIEFPAAPPTSASESIPPTAAPTLAPVSTPAAATKQAPSARRFIEMEAGDLLISGSVSLPQFYGAGAIHVPFSGAVLLARDGEVLTRKGYGMADFKNQVPITPETLFPLGVTGQKFTAVAIMQLQERGLLDVNDTIGTYLEEVSHGDEITIHHLLTHTSGLPDADTPDRLTSVDTVIESLADRPLKRQPGGERLELHDYDYILLGGIVEEVSGLSLDAYLKENIFDPLGMTNTMFLAQGDEDVPLALGYPSLGRSMVDSLVEYHRNFVEDTEAEIEDVTKFHFAPTANGAWGLWSNVDDLYLWDRALYTDDILSQDSLEEMYKVHADLYLTGSEYGEFFRGWDNAWGPIGGWDYGYGWFISTTSLRRIVRPFGSLAGYQVDMRRYVDDHVTVIVLSNFEQSATTWHVSARLGFIVFANPDEGGQP